MCLAEISSVPFTCSKAELVLLLLQPAPVKMTPLGPVNQHLHGPQAKSASPAPAPAPAKRTRGKDKHPRGPRKKSKRISKDGAQRREAAAASSRAPKPRTSPNKRHARRPSQTEEDLPQVLRRPQRKRKAPASADASPVAAAPTGTHAMSSRKRSRPPVAPAPLAEQADADAPDGAAAAAKPRRASRPAKKGVKAVFENAVAQAVPAHITGQQQPQAEQQRGPVPQQPLNAVAVAPHTALAGNSMTAAVPAHLAEAGHAASSQAPLSPSSQSQASHPSALLLLAQQQMQQRLSQQAHLPAGSQQQDSSLLSQAPGAGSVTAASAPIGGQELKPLGNATAQQALLAQLISQQAAQGASAYALDGSMHPFFSQGLAGAFLRQALPAQQVSQEQAHAHDQQLTAQLHQTTAGLLLQPSAALQMPQAGMLHTGRAVTPATVLQMAHQGQSSASVQPQGAPQTQEAPGQQPLGQQASQPPVAGHAPPGAGDVHTAQQALQHAQPEQLHAAVLGDAAASHTVAEVGNVLLQSALFLPFPRFR